MSNRPDYTLLDRPELLQFVFYPRRDFAEAPSNATDHSVPVEEGVSVSCRFYVHSQSSPSILYFHGNGEVVSDYNYIAPYYNQRGINLFVADYRGYGASGGRPTFTNTIGDAHIVFKSFVDILKGDRHSGDLFVMGRSLGSISAIELAFHYQKQIKGLIVESGFARVHRLMERLGFPAELFSPGGGEVPNLASIRAIALPTLVIHGEQDSLIPPAEGRDLFDNAGTKDKRLVVIPGADHNDIMLLGLQQYFAAITEFVSG